MKRTLKEIYELIKEKYKNANADMLRTLDEKVRDNQKLYQLKGEVLAYYDVLLLIESSEVLENERA